MATLKELQQDVSRAQGAAITAKTTVLGLKEKLSIYQQELAVREQALGKLSPAYPKYAAAESAVARARASIDDISAQIVVAEQNLKIAEAYAAAAEQILADPSTKIDPEPTAVEKPALTQEQRDRLDQINAQRIENDQAPLVINTPAEFAALEESISKNRIDRSTLDTASVQTAGDAVNNATRPTGPEAGNTATKPAPTATQNIDGGSIKYVVGEGGARTVLIYDETGQMLGAGVDIGQAIDVAAKRGASPQLLSNAAAEYQSAGQATIDNLTQQLENPNYAVEKQDAAIEAATGRMSTNLDGRDRLLESENRKAGLNPNGIGEPYMLPVTPLTETKPKNATSNDTGNTNATPKVQVGSGTGIEYRETPNPLHAYASSTYGLSLHMLTPGDYKNLMSNPGKAFKPSVTLVSNANKSPTSPPRDKAFTDDFYFDNCKVVTNIGLSAAQRGTNALEVHFTLIEPYGMTFLNRLLDLSVRMKIPNYLDIPYLLEINFFGADDSGKYAKLESQTKLLPIRLIDLKIKAGTKGSEYTIAAIPYTQMSHLQSLGVAKANFEISARKVGDYFSSSKGSSAYNEQEKVLVADGAARLAAANAIKQEVDDAKRERPGSRTVTELIKSPTAIITAGSFTDAYNLWQSTEVAQGYQDVADEIEFKISDPSIFNADISEPIKANPSKTTMNNPGKNVANADTANKNAKPAGADFTKNFFNINAGTSIVTVINNMVTNSSFIRKQLLSESNKDASKVNTVGLDANSAVKQAGKPIKWFKIRTKVDLKEYDAKRGFYGKKITYYIDPYDHYESRHPAVQHSTPTASVKKYNYMYTGLNSDIIDFTIDFKALFVTVLQVDASKQAQLNSNPTELKNSKTGTTSQPGYSISPVQTVMVAATMTSVTGGSDADIEKQRAANYAANIYENAEGDMINLKMKIIGDPQFIKQDEILWAPDKISRSRQFLGSDLGSLSMDSGEIFCTVDFKTPVDIDENTGLLRKDSAWKDVHFSGYYRILTVENEFRQGKFTQTLSLIRPPNQKNDSKGTVSNASIDSQKQRTGDRILASNSDGTKATSPTPRERRIETIYEAGTGEVVGQKVFSEDGKVYYKGVADSRYTEVTESNKPDRPASVPPKSTAATTVEESPLPNDSDPNFIPLKRTTTSGETRTIDE